MMLSMCESFDVGSKQTVEVIELNAHCTGSILTSVVAEERFENWSE